MFWKKVVEKIKTHVLCSECMCVYAKFCGSYAVYEIMWKNVVEPDRPQIII
jgi:drug/metabolite transporter superfamily protein YnfA